MRGYMSSGESVCKKSERRVTCTRNRPPPPREGGKATYPRGQNDAAVALENGPNGKAGVHTMEVEDRVNNCRRALVEWLNNDAEA